MHVLDSEGNIVCELNRNGAEITRGKIRSYSSDGTKYAALSDSGLTFYMYTPPLNSTDPQWNSVMSISSYMPSDGTNIGNVTARLTSFTGIDIIAGDKQSISLRTHAYNVTPIAEASIFISPLRGITLSGDVSVINGSLSVNNGATGSFTTVDGKTVTVTDGIITGIQ